MSIELKPCPFCGGVATMRAIAEQVHYVLCINDNCLVKPDMMKFYPTMEEAVVAWNRRVADEH